MKIVRQVILFRQVILLNPSSRTSQCYSMRIKSSCKLEDLANAHSKELTPILDDDCYLRYVKLFQGLIDSYLQLQILLWLELFHSDHSRLEDRHAKKCKRQL